MFATELALTAIPPDAHYFLLKDDLSIIAGFMGFSAIKTHGAMSETTYIPNGTSLSSSTLVCSAVWVPKAGFCTWCYTY